MLTILISIGGKQSSALIEGLGGFESDLGQPFFEKVSKRNIEEHSPDCRCPLRFDSFPDSNRDGFQCILMETMD
jgi:hypothetical protein